MVREFRFTLESKVFIDSTKKFTGYFQQKVKGKINDDLIHLEVFNM